MLVTRKSMGGLQNITCVYGDIFATKVARILIIIIKT
jgi:hypothetical protein